MKKIILFLINILLASNILLADGVSTEKIKLQLQWKHQFEFAGYYTAIEKGFYEDVGLEVELIEYDHQDITKKVLSGEVEYGLNYSSIIAEYLDDKPVVLVANNYGGF